MITEQISKCDGIEKKVLIEMSQAELEGTLHIPVKAGGIVLFAHGSASSRRSIRNLYAAEVLQSERIATLLFDLLTRDEEIIDGYTGHLRFDVPFLAKRLVDATYWALRQPELNGLPIGYFGASTGAAAALVATAKLTDVIKAVVSRGGRPDLAGDVLEDVEVPTLLIVGGNDVPVVGLNQTALARLGCREKKL